MKSCYLIILLLLAGLYASSQSLYLQGVDAKDDSLLVQYLNSTKSIDVKSIAQAKEKLADFKNELAKKGYIASSVDSIWQAGNNYKATFSFGPQVKWLKLKVPQKEQEALQSAGFRKGQYAEGKVFYYKRFNNLQNALLDYYENNGYPFASVKLDSLQWTRTKLQATLKIDRSTFYKIDSIVLKGKARIVPVYLYNYLEIKPGSIYNEKKIGQITTPN